MLKAALIGGLLLGAAAGQSHAAVPAATGDWSGSLSRSDGVHRVTVHIQSTAMGGLAGTISGLDAQGFTTPLERVRLSRGELAFEASGGRYLGHWVATSGEWAGTWMQAKAVTPLTLKWQTDRLGVIPK